MTLHFRQAACGTRWFILPCVLSCVLVFNTYAQPPASTSSQPLEVRLTYGLGTAWQQEEDIEALEAEAEALLGASSKEASDAEAPPTPRPGTDADSSHPKDSHTSPSSPRATASARDRGFLEILNLTLDGGQLPVATSTPPAGQWKLPKFLSPKPVYAQVRLGDEQRLLALDYANALDRYYSLLYFDANANCDLTDDPPVRGKVSSLALFFKGTLFDAVETTISLAGHKVPYSFRCVLNSMPLRGSSHTGNKTDLPAIVLASNCFYSGSFDTGGRSYRVVLNDGNCDGDFTDVYAANGPSSESADALPSFHDRIALFSNPSAPAHAPLALGNLLAVGGSTYRIFPDVVQRVLRLEPLAEAGILELAMTPQTMLLASVDAKNVVMLYEPASEIRIPPGEYRDIAYVADRKDAQGDLWRLEAVAGKRDPVAVTSGRRARLVFGEPYRPSVTARRTMRAKGGLFGALFGASKVEVVAMDFHLQGAGGDVVETVCRLRGDATQTTMSISQDNFPAEPTYKLVKSDGELVAEGRFEYG